MKRITLVLFLLATFFAGTAQTFTPIHNATAVDYMSMVKYFGIPYGDVPALNASRTVPGALFYRTADSCIYAWTGTQWLKQAGPFPVNTDSIVPTPTSICVWSGGVPTCVYFTRYYDSSHVNSDSTHTLHFNNGNLLDSSWLAHETLFFRDGVSAKDTTDEKGLPAHVIFGTGGGGGGGGGITDLTGDVLASGTGSVAATLATVNSNVGTWNNITINAKGLATAGSNLSYLLANQAITLTATGDATGTSTSSGTSPSIALTLATVNSNVGSFTNANVTVNAKGLITAISNGSAGGTGTVTSVGLTSSDITVGGTSPITTTGTYTLTLPTVNSNVGSFTNASFTVNAKGQITAASSGSAGGVTSVSGTTNRITSTGGSTPVIDIGTDVVTLTASQTLTNKTLTSPVVNVGSDATGDIYYRNGSGVYTRLPIGSTNQFLQVAGGIPTWATSGSTGWLLSGNAGTNATTQFLGTTDNTSLSFRVNNVIRAQIAYSSFSFGNLTGGVGTQFLYFDSSSVSFNNVGSSTTKLKFSAQTFTPVYNSSGTDILTGTKTTSVNTTRVFAGNVTTQYEGLSVEGACLNCKSISFKNTFSPTSERMVIWEKSGAATAPITMIPGGDGSVIIGGTDTDVLPTAMFQIRGTAKGSIPAPVVTTAQRKAITTVILTGTITAGGTGYTTGSYPATALTNVSSSGSTATANIGVTAGAVNSVVIVSGGVNYRVGDVLSATIAGGSGFTYTVATTSGSAGLLVYDSDYGNMFSYNGLDWGIYSSNKTKNISATYTILKTDELLNATSGTFTATLPSPTGLEDKEFTINNLGAGTVTVSSSANINGSTTYPLAQYKYVKVRVLASGTYIVTANN